MVSPELTRPADPLFVLLGTRLSEIAGAVLLVALLLYSQY